MVDAALVIAVCCAHRPCPRWIVHGCAGLIPRQWYGGEHKAPELQKEAVYGLTELAREEVKGARLVANPGCYPTAAQLPLIALLRAGVVTPHDIIIDAKSGTTGAGRSPKQGTLFCEVWVGFLVRYPVPAGPA